LDVPAVDAEAVLGKGNVRREIEEFPEVSEVDAIRHFTRLSTWNYAIDLGLYPLGSCTMKYNPRVNELVARTEGLAWAHPYQSEELSQGCMEVMAQLEQALAGCAANAEAIAAACAAADQGASPTDDLTASADYRRHLVRVLAARAVQAAAGV